MSVTHADVRKVANLSRIALPEDQVAHMTDELNGILGWIEQLNEVDVDGVEPLTSVVEVALPMREDIVTDGNIQSKILSNAPSSEDGFFVVPKVVE